MLKSLEANTTCGSQPTLFNHEEAFAQGHTSTEPQKRAIAGADGVPAVGVKRYCDPRAFARDANSALPYANRLWGVAKGTTRVLRELRGRFEDFKSFRPKPEGPDLRIILLAIG